MPTTFAGPGSGDTAGAWMDSNSVYVGPELIIGFAIGDSSNPGGAFNGISWLNNVFVLPRSFWPAALGNPAGGQIYPTGGLAGQGQINPN